VGARRLSVRTMALATFPLKIQKAATGRDRGSREAV
jgi:hypothetical protein